MRVDAEKFSNISALHHLGAIAVSEARDEDDRLIGYDLFPDVDLDGYPDAVTAVSKPPVPEIISDRQFAQALADSDVITQAEALAFVRTGTLPDALQSAVDGIKDAATKFAAEMLLSGATSFERTHLMVGVLGQALNKSDADLDALWVLGAAL